MKNKVKVLIPTLIAAVLLFGSAPVFADSSNNTTSSTTSNISVTSATYAGLTDADLAQIDTLFNKNLNLLISLKQTDVQIHAADQTIKAAMRSLHIDNVQDSKKLKEIENQIKIMRDSLQDFDKQIKALRAEMKHKNDNQKKAIKAQIREIQLNIQAVKDQIKEKEKSAKEIHSDKQSDKLKALMAQIKGIEDQIKAIQQKDATLDNQRKAGWVAFDAAIQSINISNASAALSTIVDTNQNILADKQQILTLKQSIASAINSYANVNSSTTGKTTSNTTSGN